MATITLKYQKNQSQEVRIEDLIISSINGEWTVEDNKTPSFFLEEYKEAIEILNGILSVSSDGNTKTNKGKEDDKKRSERSINNRILFVGQRGTGKTSAMKSFADGLDKAENDSGKAFACLPMIDPSNFDNNTNILLTVITMMFSEAKSLMNKKNDDEDVISKRENLLKRFDDAFKSLKAIQGSERPSFTLEGLNEKSLALKMHSGMYDLVKNYLNFYNTVNETHVNRLVLLIDDIDMTVSHAPEMLEQLRKYLDIENVIILMSANLAQLYNEMREHYSKAFKETLKDNNQALSIDVEDLANKYLLKLFPTSRRVRVEHSVKQLIDADLEINVDRVDSHIINLGDAKGSFKVKYEKGNGEISGSLDCNNIVVDSSLIPSIESKQSIKGKLQNVILSLIWEKTRLLFIPKDPENVLHPIIPTNLRELMQFLDMITSLEDVKYKDPNNPTEMPKLFWDKKSYESCRNNVAKFKKYFLHNWIPSHLPVEEELVFNNIPTDITEINKHLINSINVIGNKHKNDLMSREVGLEMIERNAEDVINIDRDIYTMVSLNDPKFIKANKISDIFNQPSNYSYGDLLLMIDKYETYFESEDNRKFSDAIKIYYSILLIETMFFGSANVIYDKKDLPKSKKDNTPQQPELIPIQKLIGGTVYYPNYFEIIEDKYFNQKGPSFDAKRAFYHKLLVGNDEIVGNGYPFFAVLYYGDIRPDRYDIKHIYDTTFENNATVDGEKYVTFDILSILSNMLNPWHTYFRAGDTHFKTDAITSWGEKIKKWGDEMCLVENVTEKEDGKILIPNSILPFYSVDMMLQYLKYSQPTHVVVGDHYPNDLAKIEIMRDVYKKVLLGDENTSSNVSLWKEFVEQNKQKEIIQGEKELYFDELLSVKENDKHLIKVNWSKKYQHKLSAIGNDILIQYIRMEPALMISEIKVLLNNLFIISKIFVCYKKHSSCPPIHGVRNTTEPFKNYVIAVLLNHYTGASKNRNTLIKELHKASTISETYRMIVDYLWINAVNETLIRIKIQMAIRDIESVGNYYGILWGKTQTVMNRMFDGEAVKLYERIYLDAKKVFIYEKPLSDARS